MAQTMKEDYSKEDTLFIFDWDDTILPTTWLALNDLRVDMLGDPPQHLKTQLDEYAPWAMKTLEEAQKYGKVLIVTNAEDGWIELTVKKFFPSWQSTVDRIPYHSARSTWEPTGCSMPVEWKVRSFAHEIENFYEGKHKHGKPVRRNIIGLGDSTSDREAMLHVCGSKQNTIGKSLKFMERPNLEHLQKQHHLIASSIRQIALHEKSLDLCIQHQMSVDSESAGGGGAAAAQSQQNGGTPETPSAEANRPGNNATTNPSSNAASAGGGGSGGTGAPAGGSQVPNGTGQVSNGIGQASQQNNSTHQNTTQNSTQNSTQTTPRDGNTPRAGTTLANPATSVLAAGGGSRCSE